MKTNTPYFTDMPFLNRLLPEGLPSGKLIGLIGPSGGGKTLLAMQIAYTLSYYPPGHSVLFLGLEPGNKISQRLKMLARELDYGRLNDEQKQVRDLVPDALCSDFLHIRKPLDVTIGIKPSDIPDIVDALDVPPVLIIVDQLQCLIQGERDLPKEEVVKRCCDTLREYADQAGISILLLHQRNPALHAAPSTRHSTNLDAMNIPNVEDLMDIGLFIGMLNQNQCGLISNPSKDLHESVWLDGDHNRFRDVEDRNIRRDLNLQLNWDAVYSYFLPEIIENYKQEYIDFRNGLDAPKFQQPYGLNTSRYDDFFWEEVFQEHRRHECSFHETLSLFLGPDGCGCLPWPSMIKKAPELFSERGLYSETHPNLIGSFAFDSSSVAIKEAVENIRQEGDDERSRVLLHFMISESWDSLVKEDNCFVVADYIERFLSKGTASKLEEALGPELVPFFNWIATLPPRGPQP